MNMFKRGDPNIYLRAWIIRRNMGGINKYIAQTLRQKNCIDLSTLHLQCIMGVPLVIIKHRNIGRHVWQDIN